MLEKDNKESNGKLYLTTDIHCHILPSIDDGSASLSQSILMVKAMIRWGIKHIIATPHIRDTDFINNKSTISNAYTKLTEALVEQGIEVDIKYAAEYRIDSSIHSIINESAFMPLFENYVLLENHFDKEHLDFDNTMRNIKSKGHIPILAHPERYAYYISNPKRYEQIHNLGVKFQINVLSLAGYYGADIQHTAETLISLGYVDYIGTDIHNEKHVECIDNYLKTKLYHTHALALHHNNR